MSCPFDFSNDFLISKISPFDFSNDFLISKISPFDFSNGFLISKISPFDFSNDFLISKISPFDFSFFVSSLALYPQTTALLTSKWRPTEKERSKDEINALIDAYSDAKMSADPMTTNRELYSSIKSLLELNNDVQRSTKQIETKVKKLKSGYSKLKDRVKVFGAERPYDSKSGFQGWKRSLFNTGIILTAF